MVMKTNLIFNLSDGFKPNSKHSLKPDLQSAALNKHHFTSWSITNLYRLACFDVCLQREHLNDQVLK